MTGIRTIRLIKELEETAYRCGMKITPPQYSYGRDYGDTVALMPRDDELPCYTRDAQLWTGSVEEMYQFFQGLDHARRYYQMLGLVTEEKIAKREQQERNRQLLETIKNAEKKDG